jgi:hypothetical protein
VAAAVDAHLRGRPLPVEVRYRNEQGEIVIETHQPVGAAADRNGRRGSHTMPIERSTAGRQQENRVERRNAAPRAETFEPTTEAGRPQPLHVYAYGVARNRLLQAAKRMRLPVMVEDDLGGAQAVITLKNYYRRRPKLIMDAERRGVPVYVLRANTLTQMEDFLADIFGVEGAESVETDPFAQAVHETEAAIESIRSGAKSVDLTPASSPVRRMQHDMARDANLVSHSYGKDPRRHVRIFREVHTRE